MYVHRFTEITSFERKQYTLHLTPFVIFCHIKYQPLRVLFSFCIIFILSLLAFTFFFYFSFPFRFSCDHHSVSIRTILFNENTFFSLVCDILVVEHKLFFYVICNKYHIIPMFSSIHSVSIIRCSTVFLTRHRHRLLHAAFNFKIKNRHTQFRLSDLEAI